MLNLTLLLAAFEPPELDPLKNAARNNNPQVLGVLLGLAAILFFWAFFLRGKPTHVRGSVVVSRTNKPGSDPKKSSSSGHRRRKRRADHPSEWSRNPTLSETGGLPPPRPEEPETPSGQTK
jgi:hypothetical protein